MKLKNLSTDQGQRRVRSSLCCNWSSWHFWWGVVSDHWSNGNFTPDLRTVFLVKGLLVYLREALLSRINPILWHTLSLLLLFAPRRLPSSLSSDPSMSSWFPTQKSDCLACWSYRTFRDSYGFQLGRAQVFLADHVHARARIYNKLSFLRVS